MLIVAIDVNHVTLGAPISCIPKGLLHGMGN